ncbi:unnamed protein product [Caenorhabditis auriculariae]|uniref:Uncharacterized protein n=1 Tax=Caenorhabditis auriculariae TaxID=2777116 RepID=A0A8S1HFS1_9PELO|nr:unnamed protein product [Caenorhabditis auriculariae]
MGCTYRAGLNHLCSIWYTLLAVALQAYLLYLGFERYRLYNEIKWPTAGYPQTWLSVYIILYSVCIPCLLLFLAFGVFKSGNIPGDNEKLADREERVLEIIWQHLPPLPQQIHIFVALCQLVGQQLMIAQLYRNGFINSGPFLLFLRFFFIWIMLHLGSCLVEKWME